MAKIMAGQRIANTVRPDLIKCIRRLCQLSLDGAILLDQFRREWPGEIKSFPFFQILFEDVEDGIIHLPGYWFKSGINAKHWFENSDIYLTIYLDLQLLDCENEEIEDLSKCREFILNKFPLTTEVITRYVKDYFLNKEG